ncbi:MAG: carbon starvation CstA family protein [Actinomycetaceae bacterium]|nr:carbon starvation CstA family protein [Actinomycetaceae bacterium]
MSKQIELVKTSKKLPPVAIVDNRPISLKAKIVFGLIALVGAFSWYVVAFSRHEEVNARYFVLAAICTYIIAYRFYARLIEYNVVRPRDDRATPAEVLDNGQDFEPTDRRVLYGHHFAAIAGAGPLVGPVLAAQMGYLPGTIWIIVGVVFAGAVQDYLVLWLSVRRKGRSLPQMIKDEMGTTAGWLAIAAILSIMVILIAVLGIVMVNALAESPWGVFSIAMTIPIAMFMGVYLRYIRPGAVSETSLIGLVLLLLAIVAGGWVAATPWGVAWFTLTPVQIAWLLIGYGFFASVLPVWLLLAPRDYLSTYMKVGTIALLAIGILVVGPNVKAQAVTQFALDGTGPVFAGNLFPFLFITIACGALSGFHALISSGTTPKLLEKESQARFIGYTGMLTESSVAIMAMVTAIIIDPHIYFAMNAPAGLTGGLPGVDPVTAAQSAAEYVNGLGLHSAAGQPLTNVDPQVLTDAAAAVEEPSIVSRTGGAPTLAFGMSMVFHTMFGGAEGWQAFWYHFAIMFEALFILTTIDAGTRTARFMFTDAISNFGGPFKKFADPSWKVGNWGGSLLVVLLWGSILLMGITDPLGGIRVLFPLFGIANQLLAAVALTLVWVVIHKKGLHKWGWIAFVPLSWDLLVTVWASMEKLFSTDPKIGFWANNRLFVAAREAGETSLGPAKTAADIDTVIRNTYIQMSLQALYVVLVVLIVGFGVRMVIKSYKGTASPLTEEGDLPSLRFAPRSLVATKLEKQIMREWKNTDPKVIAAQRSMMATSNHSVKPTPGEAELAATTANARV